MKVANVVLFIIDVNEFIALLASANVAITVGKVTVNLIRRELFMAVIATL
jgi:hypothetical protein